MLKNEKKNPIGNLVKEVSEKKKSKKLKKIEKREEKKISHDTSMRYFTVVWISVGPAKLYFRKERLDDHQKNET